MSREYYYFVASLPLLQFADKMPFSVEEFLSEAERFLTPEEGRFLLSALKDNEVENVEGLAFLSAYKTFDNQLKTELLYARAGQFGVEALQAHFDRAGDLDVIQAAAQAFKADNPLPAESIIDKAHWIFIDNALQGHFFDLECVIGYGIKLKILERQNLFASSVGLEKYKQYKQILDDPAYLVF